MSERTKIVKALDDITSKIVRYRDGRCVICGLPTQFGDKGDPISNTCGHYLSRKTEALRWNMKNCNTQCYKCNSEHNFDIVPYTRYMVNEYGEGILEELHDIVVSGRMQKITTPQLRQMLDEYKDIYKKMKAGF